VENLPLCSLMGGSKVQDVEAKRGTRFKRPFKRRKTRGGNVFPPGGSVRGNQPDYSNTNEEMIKSHQNTHPQQRRLQEIKERIEPHLQTGSN